MPAALRLPLILLIALLINVAIFSVIQYMVGNPRVRLTEVENFDIANFIRMQEQSREVRSRREPRAPEKPKQEQQQQLQRLADAASGRVSDLAVDIPDLQIDVGLDIGGDIQIARELTPLVRVPPEYPHRALAEDLEGYVLLRFTVTETGAVADPEVLRAEPPGVFERAARRAVLRWKFQPQIRDGKPTAVVAMTQITFVLADEPED
jgi:protein TonB